MQRKRPQNISLTKSITREFKVYKAIHEYLLQKLGFEFKKKKEYFQNACMKEI
jgi:hypothetical protein